MKELIKRLKSVAYDIATMAEWLEKEENVERELDTYYSVVFEELPEIFEELEKFKD